MDQRHYFCLLLLLFPHLLCAQILKLSLLEEGFEIKEGNESVLFFQTAMKGHPATGLYPRAQYIHPLYHLDGQIITEDFPEDHLHHRGIFWAWHQIMIGDSSIGDGWECKDIMWDIQAIEIDSTLLPETLSTTITTLWKSNKWTDEKQQPIPFVKEHTILDVYPKKEHMRVLDINIVITPLVDQVQLGGSEDEKGYGGFSPRFILPEDLTFTGQYAEVEPQNLQLDGGNWMDISGSMGMNHRLCGVTILAHPSNPTPNNKWILRRSGSMQNAVFPGRHLHTIPKGQSLTLRYRLLIHEGDARSLNIEKLFNEYGQIQLSY